MIPNVCFQWCKKSSECPECKQLIEVATPCIMVFYWNKGNEDKRSYNVKKFYHPNCWIAQGMVYLMMNPYNPGEQRGPRVELTPEDRRKRQLLLRRYGTLQYRKRQYGNNPTIGLLEKTLIELHLDAMIASVILEISQVGGIPKRWLQKLIST